ncbi:hypothetical protein TNCV_175401 [Trichonephila clavipes]|nr:hypothetical protein TNCV_175401 [Trichonephila clavipes]
MMEAGWSVRRVIHQLGLSAYVVKRCWDQLCTRRKAQDALDRLVIEKTATSKESRFNLSSDANRVCVWIPSGERLNPAFALQRHTALTAGAVFQQDNARPRTARVSQDCPSTVTKPSFNCPIPRFVSNRAYLGSFGMLSLYEL